MKTLIRSLCLVTLFVGGCARMQYTIEEEIPAGTQATKKSRDRFVVSYTGTAGGARELVDVATRRRQTTDAGDIAKMSVERGLPVSIGATPGSTNVTSGYQYGMYGYGYPYGGAYGQVMYAEQASFGYGQGYLPRLGEPPVMALPSPSAETVPTHASVGRVECPKSRSPTTDAERISCLEQDRATILQEIRKKE